MGNDKPDDAPDKKASEKENEMDIHGLVDEVDENAQTVLFQRAINPDELREYLQDSEETKLIPAIDEEEVKRLMSDEELNRIVDEVKAHGALPMDTLPSAVEDDDDEDDKE